MGRVIAHLVTRNEADRYLHACLDWLRLFVDDISVFDDASTDDTIPICKKAEAHVVMRSPGIPSFLEHEGRFRAAAWATLAAFAEPGDWIFAIDADEFLIAESGELHKTLAANIDEADELRCDGIQVTIREVWGFDSSDRPLIRVDGFWGTIQGVRLARWTGKHEFPDRPLGCGSVPQTAVPTMPSSVDLTLLHYGYSAPEDRQLRHARYVAHDGHNERHVRSILEHPTLVAWDGARPHV